MHVKTARSDRVLARCRICCHTTLNTSPASIFLELPVELWSSVIAHLPRRSDVAHCCLVSRAFRAEAERLLYRDVELHNDQIVPFYTTIVRNRPDLAFLVKRFSLHLLSDRYLINPILKSLSNLRDLDLFVGGGKSSGYAGSFLRGCIFDLRTFSSDFVLTKDLCDFLATQSNLRDWYTKPNMLPTSDAKFPILPALTTLRHSGRFSSWISGPQNITHLRVDLGFCSAPSADKEEEEIARICEILGQQLVSFVIHQNFPVACWPGTPPIVSYILRRAPVLKFLALYEPEDVYIFPRRLSLFEEVCLPRTVETQLETLVWSPGSFAKGGAASVNSLLAGMSGSLKPFSASESVQNLGRVAGGAGDPTSTLGILPCAAQHALAAFPSIRRLVLIGETQYLWDADGVYAPISDLSWKEV